MKKIRLFLIGSFFIALAFLSSCDSGGNLISSSSSHVHTWDKGTVTKEATCLSGGEKTYKCTDSNCGKIKIETFDATVPHTEVVDVAVEPTCSIVGLTEGKHCGVCHKVFIAQETISTLNHTFVNGACKMCGATEGLKYTLSSDGSYYIVSEGTATNKTTIVIPAYYNGLPVSKIGEYAFSSCISLTSITIPNSVTSIGNGAFLSCSSLTSITIPNSVTSIGESAFRSCSSLESITLPFVGNTLNGTTNTNFGYIFGPIEQVYNDKNVPKTLKEVIITGGTSIGKSAFADCSSLESITIPNSVTSIGAYAFYDCRALKRINIPNRVKRINNHTFDGCSSLTSITIPEGVTRIGACAFDRCSSLKSIWIPKSVSVIESYAFTRSMYSEVYYAGTKEQWNSITIENGNFQIASSKIYYNMP